MSALLRAVESALSHYIVESIRSTRLACVSDTGATREAAYVLGRVRAALRTRGR